MAWWAAYGIVFWYVEAKFPAAYYTPVYMPLDDHIPFCELFVFPYLFWFAAIVGILLYLGLYDLPHFRRTMYFFMLTYTATLVIYFLWPTCQELRPETFLRDNFMTRFMAGFYDYDTNTNVCPSLHVLGAFACCFGGWYTPRFRAVGWRIAGAVICLLVSVSTVFLKQHSFLDVLLALPLAGAAWLLFRPWKRAPKKEPVPAETAP